MEQQVFISMSREEWQKMLADSISQAILIAMNQTAKKVEPMLTAEEVCEQLHICRSTLLSYQRKGIIKPMYIANHSARYKVDDVNNLLRRPSNGMFVS